MPAGRPLKFGSKKELEDKIQAYFDSCWEVVDFSKEDNSPIKKLTRPYTISGLAVALDTSRQTLINYEEREEYFDTIKKAKDIIENYTEEQLYRNTQVTGVIFNLKNNYDWKDKTETDITTQGESINFNENQAKAIAERIAKGSGANDNLPSEEKSG